MLSVVTKEGLRLSILIKTTAWMIIGPSEVPLGVVGSVTSLLGGVGLRSNSR